MPFDPTALLRHRDFVRAVAGRLLQDPHLVDDVEQETWATALARPPRSRDALGGWLAKVARRLAFRAHRARERRGRRERASSPPRPPSSPDQLALALESQQRVVEAVLRLDRLYREVVLLRFYEALAPRDAAARLGVPVNTVRTRTRRALELLRTDLQRRPSGRRALGLLPLLVSLVPRRTARWTIGALLMSKMKLAAVAAVLFLSATVAWQLAPRGRTPRAAAPAPAVAAPSSAESAICRLTGSVVDEEGRLVAAARIEISTVETVTDDGGAFALETALVGPAVVVASLGPLRAQQAVELRHGDISAGTLVLRESVTVTGIVLEPGGGGAPGAVVEAWPQVVTHPELVDDPLVWTKRSPPILAATFSGEDGAFRLALPRGAAMILRARKGELMSGDEGGCDLREDTGIVVLRLRVSSAFRGRVTDLAGAPVAGAAVDLLPPARKWGFVETRSVRGLSALTGPDGTFAIRALPDAYAVLVTHPDFVPFHSGRILVPRDGWEIALSPGQALRGVVRARGEPVPGATVRLVPDAGYSAPQEALADEEGKFDFEHALPGAYHVFADGGRLGSALLQNVLWRGEEISIELDPGVDLEGRVVLEDGTGVEGVRVWTCEFSVQTEACTYLRGYREAVSGPDGSFRLAGVSRAVWGVTVHPAESRYEDLRRGSQENGKWTVVVAPFGSVRVEIVDPEGEPLAGVEVLSCNGRRAFTDALGCCAVDRQPEVRARKQGYRMTWGKVPKDGSDVRLVLEPSMPVRGVVKDESGHTLAAVRVTPLLVNEVTGQWQWLGTTFSGADGAFSVDLLGGRSGDGDQRLRLERAGFVESVVRAAPRAEPWEFVLKRAVTLRGRVVDEAGKPIPGAAAGVQRDAARGVTTWTAADGRFVLEDIGPGETISLRARGYASRQGLPVEPGEEERIFVLALERVIAGQVLRTDGTPAFLVEVSAHGDEPGVPALGAFTDPDGRFRIAGLTAGRYTLYLRAQQSDAEWDPVKGVVAGTTGLVLREKQPSFVGGVVTDEKGRGLAGARVNLFDGEGRFVKGDQVDGQGRFRIPVRGGAYEVRVNLVGLAFRRVRGVASGTEDLVLRFEPGQEIRGQLISAAGVAPGSASVQVSSEDFHGYAEVDGNGGFAIRGLAAGTYDLRAGAAPQDGGQAIRGTARAEAGAMGIRIELTSPER